MDTPTSHPGSSQQGRPQSQSQSQSQSQHQGKTPASQSSQHAATPPVSTPLPSVFSPLAARLSPQQFKKSPAAAGMSGPNLASLGLNFDSPGVLGALQQAGLDLNVGDLAGGGGLDPLPKNTEDEFSRRLDETIAILSKSKGLVSENGLERLTKRVGLECMWEPGKTAECKRNLVVAGSALELQVGFRDSVVQSVELSFPDSTDMVTRHASRAAQILLDDLKLAPGQITLTKSMAPFAANFERLAALDRLSVNGLNLYEAVAGVYESLLRLHHKELREHQAQPGHAWTQDSLRADKDVLCTGSGRPVMHAHGTVGVALEYWVERHLMLPRIHAPEKRDRTWALIIGCAALPLEQNSVLPVRISDKWTDPAMDNIRLPIGAGAASPALWLEPDRTYIQPSPENPLSKTGAGSALPGLITEPRLPEVGFLATFDPPICLPLGMIDQLRGMGCAFPNQQLELMADGTLKSLENLLIPALPESLWDPDALRTIIRTRKIPVVLRRSDSHDSVKKPAVEERTHINTLSVLRANHGKRVTEMFFSHPRQLCELLPFLRVYGFFAMLLQKSFDEEDAGGGDEDDEDAGGGDKGGPNPRLYTRKKCYFGKGKDAETQKGGSTSASASASTAQKRAEPKPKLIITTNDPNFRPHGSPTPSPPSSPPTSREDEQLSPVSKVDVTIVETVPPRLHVSFPLRDTDRGKREVLFEIRQDARVHILEQNVIVQGEKDILPDKNGMWRPVQSIARLLEKAEDLDTMCEVIKTRWVRPR